MNNIKEITLSDFINECKSGNMTRARIEQIVEYYYSKGWNDCNKMRRSCYKLARNRFKNETDVRKDATSDVANVVADISESGINDIRKKIIDALKVQILTFLAKKELDISHEELLSIVDVSIANERNAIVNRIRNIDEEVEQAIFNIENKAEQQTIFND